jgi:hypothetical protein
MNVLITDNKAGLSLHTWIYDISSPAAVRLATINATLSRIKVPEADMLGYLDNSL